MAYLFRHNWLWLLLAFLIGAIITWFLLNRREPPPVEAPAEQEEPVEEKTLVAAGVAAAGATPTPAPQHFEEPVALFDQTLHEPEPEPEPEPAPEPAQPAFSVRMDAGEPTLFDDAGSATGEVQAKAEPVPPGRYGEGSADAVAHQGPPDGFTIKGNAQSMLFHTPDSPYYGRTKAEVWFRTEADAERAGFTKYVRKPRKSARPTD
ncbi:hypothetical protein GCM10009554_02410 [Kribbella koreensis]|uniref:Membrane protein ArfC n=1 Tax=Kribbella koreensis TaxID=57909 RepID=A0ABP3ZLD6_9ACTN